MRFAWAAVTPVAWDAHKGVVRPTASAALRVTFYGLDSFHAAAAFTLYTIVARFWAELAYAARQGSGATRPIGGSDHYR